MNQNTLGKILTYSICLVWFINGIVKILNLVPRHEMIVAEILGTEHSRLFTIFIGFSEIVMVAWILSRYKVKLNAKLQIFIVLTMNILEALLVPNLLYWGYFNFGFAMLFIGMVYYNTFVLRTNLTFNSK